jgi:hypothetical protein
MLNVVVLSVVMLTVVMLTVIVMSVDMLNRVIQSVVMLIVAAHILGPDPTVYKTRLHCSPVLNTLVCLPKVHITRKKSLITNISELILSWQITTTTTCQYCKPFSYSTTAGQNKLECLSLTRF